MNKESIIRDITEEIEQLQAALSALQPNSAVHTPIRNKDGRTTVYRMTPESRKKIGDAQKARWERLRAEKVSAERAASSKIKEADSSASRANRNKTQSKSQSKSNKK